MRTLVSTSALIAALGLAACATATTDTPAAPAARAVAAPAAAPAAPAPAAAATPAANTQAFSRVIDLGQGVSMLMGQGGNLGLLVGEDGAFMIDDQFTTNAAANLAKVEELAKGKPKYLINTHWHFDHAGGNEVFAKAGATIFASDAVRKRLTGEVKSQSRGAPQVPAPQIALPVVTFTSGIDFHLNGQTIRAIRAPMPAHTDGDTFIYFVEADVLHTGDTYMKDRYPFVDTGSGGTQIGFIAAIKKALDIAKPTTKIIPGHGELATRADLEAALAMHEGARAAVEAQIKAGKTLEQAIAAKPLAQWTTRFGSQAGSDDAYVTVIYNELKK
ncbi:MAG TPA: MBL fold metallo-hydrolase [Hyphomonadaceae bacterium]|nr:MBL fold metallo-hydrolase [Hyphomonadaceae bacterium]